MATATVSGQAKVKELAEFLATHDGAQLPVCELPADLADVAVLAAALHAGSIEFGVPEHVHVIDEKTKKPKLILDTGKCSWTDLRSPGRKPLRELLAEHANDKNSQVQLQVRLTTSGHAKTL